MSADDSSGHPERILVMGPAWVGDMVMAQSLLKTLKQYRPEASIDVAAPAWSEALLQRMPEVNRAIPLPLKHGQLALGSRYRLAKSLQFHGYQQAILLPNSFKSALLPFWAKIPRRTGFLGECRWGLVNDLRVLDKTRLTMMVQRFVALGLEHDAVLPAPVMSPALCVQPDQVAMALRRHGLERPRKPLLGLCPGAEYGPAKCWPAEYFLQIAKTLNKTGWTVWIFGSHKDTSMGHWIASQSDSVDLTGKTSLAEAVDLLSLTDGVVSNDSGLMHMAAALNRNLVAIYGSSDPGFTPPLSSKATILSLQLPCSPCFQRHCPLTHLKCLRDLLPERVLAVIKQWEL
jgi:heptosyltransferase-2